MSGENNNRLLAELQVISVRFDNNIDTGKGEFWVEIESEGKQFKTRRVTTNSYQRLCWSDDTHTLDLDYPDESTDSANVSIGRSSILFAVKSSRGFCQNIKPCGHGRFYFTHKLFEKQPLQIVNLYEKESKRFEEEWVIGQLLIRFRLLMIDAISKNNEDIRRCYEKHRYCPIPNRIRDTREGTEVYYDEQQYNARKDEYETEEKHLSKLRV
ncbi:hypothetical protein QYM36_003771 [Artemia franciscana]|uniref:Uncharacterized protein n=1 Tax=Artemia franciscana TaxID=6661 RepID=A0AA88L7T9_ARTSF|nr:hypothetical protein QYM36_003771 [Artemia franciscana]